MPPQEGRQNVELLPAAIFPSRKQLLAAAHGWLNS
jgi:hypothetical protein